MLLLLRNYHVVLWQLSVTQFKRMWIGRHHCEDSLVPNSNLQWWLTNVLVLRHQTLVEASSCSEFSRFKGIPVKPAIFYLYIFIYLSILPLELPLQCLCLFVFL